MTPGKLYVFTWERSTSCPKFKELRHGYMHEHMGYAHKGEIVMLLEVLTERDKGMKALTLNGEIIWYFGSLGGWEELTEEMGTTM